MSNVVPITPRMTINITQTARTTPVSRLVSGTVGHVTFLSSRRTSEKNPLTPLLDLGMGIDPVEATAVGLLSCSDIYNRARSLFQGGDTYDTKFRVP